MKLTDLIKKESERTNQEIKFDAPTVTHVETPKKVFKKERIWLEGAEESIKNPLENQPSINNQKTITEPIIKQSLINRHTLEKQEPTILQGSSKPSREPSNNQPSINNQKTITKLITGIVGNEAAFLGFVVDECSKNGALQTGKITTDVLKANFALNANGIANLIFRIKEKGLVEIVEQKLGRVSYRVFSVSKEVYDHFKSLGNHQVSIKKALDKPSSKSSNLDLDSSRLDFKEENLLPIRIPETIKSLISQREVADLLAKKLLSEEDLQSCLDHFAFDYERNAVRAKTTPINLLYGLVRAGKKYRSIKLLELENQELQEYEKSLHAVESENQRLKQLGLKEKYEEFKRQNPTFIEQIKAENKFVANDEVADKVGFSKFLESQP